MINHGAAMALLMSKRKAEVKPRGLDPNVEWHKWLGKIPDTQISKRYNVHRTRVINARKAAGIPPCPRK